MIVRQNVLGAIGALWIGANTFLWFSDMPLLAGCDNKAPSGSVGACYEPGEAESPCSSATTPDLCNTINHVEVMNDFPTSCVDANDHNCNEPLRDCWRYVVCQWDDGACIFKEAASNWTQKKRRVDSMCSSS